MRTPHYVLIGAVLLVAVNGCKKDDDEPPPMPAAPTTSTPPPEPTVLTTAEPAGPGEVVRPELDGREDGGTGATVTASGAKALVKVPTDWKMTKGTITSATSPDGESRLAVGSGSDALSEMDELTEKAGVSGCEWQSPQTLTVGKDKLSAQAADGKCGGKPAAYMATENLVVFGSWDEGSDRNALFGIMRSVAKVKAGKARVSKLIACCRMLAQNAKSQPPPQSAFMMQAAATCEAAAKNNNLAAVNAALGQFGMKCQ